MANEKAKFEKVTSPKFRVSFPNIFQPQTFKDENGQAQGEPKYGLVMLFDEAAQKTPEYAAMQRIAKAAVVAKWGSDSSKWPKNLRSPFRDGNDEKGELEGYKDCKFASATTKTRPGLVGADLQPIINADDFYPGCYARATVTAYAYDKKGNRGVAFGLGNVQKVADGESFSGRTKAEDDFEKFDDGGKAAPEADGDDPFMK